MWFKNLSLKFTALGLAVLLWFHVATNRVYEYPVTLALAPGILPAKFALASPIPDRVRLQVAGTGKELIRFLWEDGRVELLLEPHMSGSYPITPDRLLLQVGADVEIQQVLDPIALNLEVDSVITRRVPVRFQGEYALATDMALSSAPAVMPESVDVKGPRVLVDRLGAVATQAADVGMLSTSTEQTVGLELGTSNSLSASPDSVDVRFVLERAVTRQLGPIPVHVPDGWRADPPSVTVTLAGAPARLEGLGPGDCLASANPARAGGAERLTEVEVKAAPLVDVVSTVPPRVRLVHR